MEFWPYIIGLLTIHLLGDCISRDSDTRYRALFYVGFCSIATAVLYFFGAFK